MSILGSIFVICVTVKEANYIMVVMSYVTNLSQPFLSTTLVSAGFNVGYLVNSGKFAREGYTKMAFASCFGGPMSGECFCFEL